MPEELEPGWLARDVERAGVRLQQMGMVKTPNIKVEFRVDADTPEAAAELLNLAATSFKEGTAYPYAMMETARGKIKWEIKSLEPEQGPAE